jgi:Acyl-CoA reductase (LuxC)
VLQSALEAGADGVIRLPALIRGRLEVAPSVKTDRLRAFVRGEAPEPDGVVVIARPVLDRRTLLATGEEHLLVFAAPDARRLVEPDPAGAIRELDALPAGEVLAYVAELRRRLDPQTQAVEATVEAAAVTSPIDSRALRVFAAQLAGLLDPDTLAMAIDRDLSFGALPGSAYVGTWGVAEGPTFQGPAAQLSERIHGTTSEPVAPRLRAVPTRQLHITAGNSPIVPVVSTIWALATRGAAVVKSPAEAPFGAALLATAMADVDPSHPLTRHTALAYWRGGDRRLEDELLATGAFDRIVVWGSGATVSEVARRAEATKTILLGPRAAVSLIGRDALTDGVREVAVRAAADSLVADQAACNSSLVHYVEASEAEALAYCEELRDVLATWDRQLPHAVPRETAGRLRRLKRGAFAHGTWFENGVWPLVTSVVVYLPTGFRIALHPAGRCVVVRRVDDLRDAMRALDPSVAAVGLAPESVRSALRDEIVARGVDNVKPLGEAERGYPGMPHDGMRVLSELVRWVNA